VSIVGANFTVAEGVFILHANYTGRHASPLIAAIVSDGFMKSLDPSASVSVTVFPLPSTFKQKATLSGYNVDTVVTFILIAVSFVAAGMITFVVREREVRAKAQQMVSGVTVLAYWLSTYLS
jgi:ATP-binding cassette, subfamily A (ABC1), member 3